MFHDVLVNDKRSREIVHERGEAGEVVAAEDAVEAMEAEAWTRFEQVERRQHGEMSAGGLRVLLDLD